MGGKAKDKRKPGCPRADGCLIDEMVSTPGCRFSDVFRTLPESKHSPGLTFFGPASPGGVEGACSRIDYFLVPTALMQHPDLKWYCDARERNPHSDHCIMELRLTATGTSTLLPRGPPRTRPPPWKPRLPRLDLASTAVKKAISTESENKVRELLGKWSAAPMPPKKTDLDRMSRQLLTLLRQVAIRRAGTGPKKNPLGEMRPLSELDRVRYTLERAHTLQIALNAQSVEPGTNLDITGGVLDQNFQPSDKTVGQFKALVAKSRNIAPADKDSWKALLAAITRSSSNTLKAAYKMAPARQRYTEHLRIAFQERPSVFFNTYLRNSASRAPPLDRATLPDGNVAWGFDEYAPIVRQQVFAPMSRRVHLPDLVEPDPMAPSSTAPPFESTSIADTKVRPWWWDQMYARNRPGGVAAESWEHLMDPTNCMEVLLSLRKATGGKSPGMDGCGIDLLKLLTAGDRVPDGRPTAPTPPSSCLRAFTEVINHCLRLHYVPPILKKGYISLVPKVKDDGSSSCEAGEMRPITVLAELGKVAGRILAERIGRVLVLHPDILCTAQRAFLKDGGVEQCLGALIDAIEDWRQRPATSNTPLYLVSYDQAKAYDSVQLYSIRASLERFNMPESFILYVLSGLDGAGSHVRTHGGLTKVFELQSSVRQGDPLAPLIYVLVSDALHAGLAQNPLFLETSDKAGYTFRSGDREGLPVRLCSCGYADDTVLLADNPARLAEMHAWVRAFFGAHSSKMNCTKTKYLCSDNGMALAPTLVSVDGKLEITPQPGSTTIRYLGVWLNLDLKWTTQKTRLAFAVNRTCQNIRENHFTLAMSIMAVQQYLIPIMRLGLLFANVPKGHLQKWDRTIRKSVFQGAAMTQGHPGNLKVQALYVATRLPRLEDMSPILRGEDLIVTLNARYPSSSTCWARLGGTLWSPGHPGSEKACRAIATSQSLQQLGTCLSLHPPHLLLEGSKILHSLDPAFDPGSWRPHVPPVLHTQDPLNLYADVSGVTIYTDGSTGEDGALPSGSSAVIMSQEPHPRLLREFRFACPPSGNNYLSEVYAVLGGILQVPSHVDVTVRTDALSSIGGVNKGRGWTWSSNERNKEFALPQRARIVQAVRAGLKCIRSVASQRTGDLVLRHVKAHSGLLDVHSLGNERADELANMARMEAAENPSKVPRHLFGQERVNMTVDRISVTGSFRGALLRAAYSRQLKGLMSGTRTMADVAKNVITPDAHRSSRMARDNHRRVTAWCDSARRSRHPEMLKFATEVLSTWLPTEESLLLRRAHTNNLGRGASCKLCNTDQETVAHALGFCTDRWSAESRAAAVQAAVLLLRGWGVARVVDGPTPEDSTRISAWFDPSGETELEIYRGTNPDALFAIDQHDRIDGLVGVLPSKLDKVLQWSKHAGKWSRTDLGTAQDRKSLLQATLLRGARQIWGARCRRMDSWWFSPAGAPARATLRNDTITRAGAAAAKRVSPPQKNQRRPSSTKTRDSHVVPAPPAGPAATLQKSVALARALHKLGDVNTTGDKEGVSQGLSDLRETESLVVPDPGFYVTNDSQLARIVAEAACVDRLDCAARSTDRRVRLPWY
jgi:ribonuclease HI